jgi:hypothetical protein
MTNKERVMVNLSLGLPAKLLNNEVPKELENCEVIDTRITFIGEMYATYETILKLANGKLLSYDMFRNYHDNEDCDVSNIEEISYSTAAKKLTGYIQESTHNLYKLFV